MNSIIAITTLNDGVDWVASLKIKSNPTYKEQVIVLDKIKKSGMKNNQFIYPDIFTMSEALFDAFYISDSDGIVISVNKWYETVTGIKAKDVIGKNMDDVLEHRYNRKDYLISFLEYDTNKESKMSEVKDFVFEKPSSTSRFALEQKKTIYTLNEIPVNGKRKEVLGIGIPIFDFSGQVTHVLTILREIKDIQKLRKSIIKSQKLNVDMISKSNIEDRIKYEFKSFQAGRTVQMDYIKNIVQSVAKTDVTVLIMGESGTGKEVLAHEIVDYSNRARNPYVAINCAAIPETLIESELFGYERGAFTGASQKSYQGVFERANGGTLFLDEIGEVSQKVQAKLLRVIQEKEVRRIGSSSLIKVDVRILCATNRDLKKMVEEGSFRKDLYYRLYIVPIQLPALRERKEDIPLLANNFLMEFNEQYGKNCTLLSSAINILEGYDWPGNVRELKNSIERLVLVGNSQWISDDEVTRVLKISGDELLDDRKEKFTLKERVNSLEKEIISSALEKYGSTHKAARALGISQPTVIRKAKLLGIDTSKNDNALADRKINHS